MFTPILRRIGSLFDNGEPPTTAEAILVLGGDNRGGRILKGAHLAKEGFAPVVVVSNGRTDYGRPEAELATDFAVRHGYPPDLFVKTGWNVHSTVEEANSAIAALRSRGVHRAIVVTSVWHTARAARVYRRLAPDLTFCVVGSADPVWHNGDWWTCRQGRKVLFMEAAKTIADFLGI